MASLGAIQDAPSHSRAIAVVLITLALAHTTMTRLVWADIPLQTDTGIWSYMGWRMLEGDRLYTDLWDTKPPGIYLVFAACVAADGAGDDRVALWLDGALSAAVLLLTYALARRFARPSLAALAVLLAGLAFSHRVLADWGCNVEKFVALLNTLATLAALQALRNRRTGFWIVAGLCTGLAGAFKQTAITFPVAATLWLLFSKPVRDSSSSNRYRPITLLWTGILLAWAPLVAWLIAADIFGDFWRLAVLYDLSRLSASGGEGSTLLEPAHWGDVLTPLRLAAFLLLPAAVGVFALFRQVSRDSIAKPPDAPAPPHGAPLLALDAALGLLIFFVAPFGYGHYLLQIVPLAGVFAAWFFERVGWALPTLTPRDRRAILAGLCAALAGGVVSLGDHLRFTFDPSYAFRRAYAQQRAAIDALVATIHLRTDPADSVLIWPPDYALSFYTARATPLQHSNADVIFQGKQYRLDPPFDAILASIESRPPALILDRTPLQIVEDPHAPGQPVLAVPASGTSLLAPPDPTAIRPEGRLVAPFQQWVQQRYDPAGRVADAILLTPRAEPPP